MLGRLLKKMAQREGRAHYRSDPGRAGIGVKVIAENGSPMPAKLVDVSAGGAAIEFKGEFDDGLQQGDERELIFTSLSLAQVRVVAVVRSTPTSDAPRRFGFQFVDTSEVFRQLDDSFYKFFNRRRFRRAKPAIGERFKADLAIAGVKHTLDVRDVSLGGISLMVSTELAEALHEGLTCEVSFKVPKTDLVLTNAAEVRHISPEGKRFRVGFALEPSGSKENRRNEKKAASELSEYIHRRVTEMDKYNDAFR